MEKQVINRGVICETSRLLLRGWKKEDMLHFARLNGDTRVMEYFLKPLTFEESMAFYERIEEELLACGLGLYAVEVKENHAFAGFVGLHNVTFDADFTPAVEISWRLLPEFWNNGYATEAAMACLTYARKDLGLNEVVAFTALPNKRSERVMQKIGMTLVKSFGHPLVAPNHPLYRHILYKTT